MTRRSDEWKPRPKAREQLAPVPVTFRELINNPDKYAIPPAFQRNQVWGLSDKQAFIDSIFLSMIHIELDAYKEIVGGKTYWKLINGFQRVSTIIEFANDGFKTWTIAQKELAEPNSDPPSVQPSAFLSSLPQEEQNHFYEFVVLIYPVPSHIAMSQIVNYFLRIQNQVPLTAAERLGVYASKAAQSANKIAEHHFWEDLYEGESKRKQKFQSSLYLLALEMGPMESVDLASGKFLHSLAAGSYDDKITDTVTSAVMKRLDDVCYLYADVQFTRRVIAVAMYQSVMLLQESGYTIKRPGDKNKLTSWLNRVIADSNRTLLMPNYSCPIQQILRPEARRTFWDIHKKTVMALFGVKDAA